MSKRGRNFEPDVQIIKRGRFSIVTSCIDNIKSCDALFNENSGISKQDRFHVIARMIYLGHEMTSFSAYALAVAIQYIDYVIYFKSNNASEFPRLNPTSYMEYAMAAMSVAYKIHCTEDTKFAQYIITPGFNLFQMEIELMNRMTHPLFKQTCISQLAKMFPRYSTTMQNICNYLVFISYVHPFFVGVDPVCIAIAVHIIGAVACNTFGLLKLECQNIKNPDRELTLRTMDFVMESWRYMYSAKGRDEFHMNQVYGSMQREFVSDIAPLSETLYESVQLWYSEWCRINNKKH